jgi:hypothetical protein
LSDGGIARVALVARGAAHAPRRKEGAMEKSNAQIADEISLKCEGLIAALDLIGAGVRDAPDGAVANFAFFMRREFERISEEANKIK